MPRNERVLHRLSARGSATTGRAATSTMGAGSRAPSHLRTVDRGVGTSARCPPCRASLPDDRLSSTGGPMRRTQGRRSPGSTASRRRGPGAVGARSGRAAARGSGGRSGPRSPARADARSAQPRWVGGRRPGGCIRGGTEPPGDLAMTAPCRTNAWMTEDGRQGRSRANCLDVRTDGADGVGWTVDPPSGRMHGRSGSGRRTTSDDRGVMRIPVDRAPADRASRAAAAPRF